MKATEKNVDQQADQDKDKKAKKPFLETLMNFFQHPVMVRIAALTIAVLAIVLTGGALIPVVTLAATFVAALIGTVGEAFHRRGLERIKLQDNLTRNIEQSYDSLEPLRSKNKKIFEALQKSGGPLAKFAGERKLVDRASNAKIATRVMRDIGIENFWTVAFFATSLNLIGVITYTCSLVFGISRISREYESRVKDEKAKENCKQLIQERCNKMSIEQKNYKDTKAVYDQYKESLIGHQTLKEICALPNVNARSETEILKLYSARKIEVAQRMKFDPLPAEASFTTNVANCLNPLKPARVEVFGDKGANSIGGYKIESATKKTGNEKLGRISPTTGKVTQNRRLLRD